MRKELPGLWPKFWKIPDLLTPVHGWFTVGSGTAILKDTEALLDELK